MTQRRKTMIESIISHMNGDPFVEDMGMLGGGGSAGTGGSTDSVDAAMVIMPGDESPELDMGLGRDEVEDQGFAPEDYEYARALVQQVGSIERAHELISNLEEVEDVLDLEQTPEFEIGGIADQMPDSVDCPTSHFGTFE